MQLKILLIVFMAPCLLSSCFDNHPKADLVIFNGNIYTVNDAEPKAESIAVLNGKIVYVGNNVNANNWVADTTQVLDLEGKTLIPGIIEGHGHLMEIGNSLINLDLSELKSFDEVINLVKNKVETCESGEWVIGSGWHQDKWENLPDTTVREFPIHDSLSNISPDNPVVLFHSSGHALLANQKAMQIAKINDKTFSPDGGMIIRNNEDRATGILLENAMNLVTNIIPEASDETKIETLNIAIEECLRNGITSFQVAGANQKTINLFHSFLKNELLKIRLYVMIDGSDEDLVQNWFAHGPSIGLGDNFLTIRALKLYADGALGSRGALLLEDYTDAPEVRGTRISELNYLMRISNQAFSKGFQVCTHCIGDRANREVLDLYEIILNSDSTKTDSRFRIEHAQHLTEEDIPRFGSLGVIPSVQAIHMSSDRPWAIDRLGEKRIQEGAYVWRKLIDSGAVVMNGTDAPVEPLNPLANFYAAVSRQTLAGQPKDGFEPKQRMTRKEALKSITINNAYGAFEEKIKGSIELGKAADFTILSKNIMTIPFPEILETEVNYTIVKGEIVYKK